MLTKEEENTFACFIKQAQMLVMREVNVYMDDWHFCEPKIPSHYKKLFVYILGWPHIFGFVTINEFSGTVNAYKGTLLKTWEIK